MRYQLKNPHVSIYIASCFLTYVAMVFCPIQHMHHKYITQFVKIAIEAPTCCTPTWQLFSVSFLNLEGDDIRSIRPAGLFMATRAWARLHSQTMCYQGDPCYV